MGLFQNLLDTYGKCSDAVGIVPLDADGNADEKKTLLPVFHMTFKSGVCVTIDKDGCFLNASRNAKELTIIIPCTEGSSGRTSGISPHPLCDQIDYLGGVNVDKTEAYLSELNSWKNDFIELNAIHSYVSKRTLIDDLINCNIFTDKEYLETNSEYSNKKLNIEKIRKLGIRFSVKTEEGRFLNVWESEDLRSAWIDNVLLTKNSDEQIFDYLSGEGVKRIAYQHPKNINRNSGNAKLLSCNDTSEFTFRGRFSKQDDALIIDFAQSQKMHQMLRWLIANYGYATGSQVIVTWGVDANTEVKAKSQYNSYELFCEIEDIKIDSDVLIKTKGQVYDDYAVKLKKILQGYGDPNYIKQHARKICIAVFDAATTGRMGLVFYQEFPEDSYLESVVNWHLDTSYFLTTWKKERDKKGKDKNIVIHYIGAPSYDDILFAVYGKSHGDRYYDTLKRKTRKLLLECMFGNFAFPNSIIELATNRASRPMAFIDSNGKFNEYDWLRAVSITCALIRKYYKQQKEEIQLELDTNRKDRDYLFGRLLSVADRLERTALYKAGKQDTRVTNATRLMNAFQIKPYSTWGQLYNQLIPYKNQLNGAGYYQSIIDSIMVLFKNGDYENNMPLSPLYLLGYSAQNKTWSKNNKNEITEVTKNVGITE